MSPLLRARLVPPDESAAKKPCPNAPDARFRGTENQLYRVEIHSAGSTPTFKWSRDNGAIAFQITAVGSDDNRNRPWKVTLQDLGRDSLHTLAIGDWVEIVDTGSSIRPRLDANAPDLLLVSEIDRETRVVTIERPIKNPDPNHPIGVPDSTAYSADNIRIQPTILRRWNQSGNKVVRQKEVKDVPVGTIKIAFRPVVQPTVVPAQFDDSDKAEASWYELEDGLWVQFQGPDADHPLPTLRVGDYWLIPARTANNGSILWSPEIHQGNPVTDHNKNPIYGPRPADGVRHYFAPWRSWSTRPTRIMLSSRATLRRASLTVAGRSAPRSKTHQERDFSTTTGDLRMLHLGGASKNRVERCWSASYTPCFAVESLRDRSGAVQGACGTQAMRTFRNSGARNSRW